MTGLYFLAAALLVAADQITKYLTRTYLMGQGVVTVIPGFLGLEYVENTGMAFSAFSDSTAMLTAISFVISLLLAVMIWKKWVFKEPFALWMVTLIFAGAVGNLIDRALFGYVTDMIKTLFMNFAVFNFADCCVVVGGILLAVYAIFFWKEEEGKK